MLRLAARLRSRASFRPASNPCTLSPRRLAKPVHQDEICNYVGGMVPFAKTAAERQANGDTRPSLQERYGSHEGYVQAVRKATERAVQERFLLSEDAQDLIDAAQKSAVLR
jgi:Alpha/beta hydrolase domain